MPQTACHPTQFECDGGHTMWHAEAFYAALLSHSLFWKRTFTKKRAQEIPVQDHGIRASDFREALGGQDHDHPHRGAKGDNPRCGAPPLYHAGCCDGFQDVYVAYMAVALEWGLLQWAHDIHDNFYSFYVRRNAIVLCRGPEMAQAAHAERHAGA